MSSSAKVKNTAEGVLAERAEAHRPRPGISLDRRLAIYAAITVALVMGLLTVPEEILETRSREEGIRTSLARSVLPLQASLRGAADMEEAVSLLFDFHHAYVHGDNRHEMVLWDGNGEVIAETAPPADRSGRDWFHAEVPVSGPSFAGGNGRLGIYEERAGFRRAVNARWRRWSLHMLATAVAVLLVLRLTIRRLVTAPLERLRAGIQKMEMGYWDEAENVGGAWEIQWINWRFWSMGKELQKTVQQFLDAEHRASVAALQPRRPTAVGPPETDGTDIAEPVVVAFDPVREEFLRQKCRELEEASPHDSGIRSLARDTIENLAPEAEALGNQALKSRLEDAALRILEPREFGRLEEKLKEFTASRRNWFEECHSSFQAALDRQLIPVQSLERRLKHTAGVWKKMGAKNLALPQVHDLFALRVVVPTEADCYWVLGVAHECFQPVVGRFKDYIANPKPNGYQSLHTCVRDHTGQILEIQIRSTAMHYHAEYGQASHIEYKKQSLRGKSEEQPPRLG